MLTKYYGEIQYVTKKDKMKINDEFVIVKNWLN